MGGQLLRTESGTRLVGIHLSSSCGSSKSLARRGAENLRARLRNLTAYAAVALVAVAVGASGTAFAQLAPAPVAPGRIEQPLQQRPAAPLPGGGVDMPMIPNTGPAPAGAESTHFVLRGVQITGVTVYPEGTFNDLYSGLIGKDVTLAQIYSVGQAITARYRGDGYIISQAVLPAQQITNGNVRIVVVEGFVDKVIVKDEKTGSTGEDRSVLDRMAQKISNDRPLTAKALERYMLLINDLPGVTARSFLAPSATTPGAADLTIVLNDKKYDGYLSTDNLGSKFVGPGEFAVAGNLDNAFGIWERTGLRYVGTYDVSELQYAEFTHEEQIGSEGGKVDLQAFRSNSEPGDLLSPLHSNALNWTGLAIFSYPFIRSRSENLSVHGTVQITNIDSTQLGITTTQDRLRVLRFGANYNKVDTWLGTEGVSLVSGELSQGLPGLGSTTSSDTLKSRQGADGEFTKFFGEVQRSQALWGNFGLLVAVQGQYAFDNLLSPE